MKNPASLVLLAAVAFVQAAYAQDTFRVTIVKGDAEPKLTPEQVEQFKKAGIASPNDLPIVVCPLGQHNKAQTDPVTTFQVVIENTRRTETKVTMGVSDWLQCLSFKLVDDNGNSYSIEKIGIAAMSASPPPVTQKWVANGKHVLPVSFFENYWGGTWLAAWGSQKGSGEHAKFEWPAPKQPVIGHLTVTFRYYADRKSVEVSSKATDVILMAK